MNCPHWLQFAIKYKQRGSASTVTPVSVEQQALNRRNMKCFVMIAVCAAAVMASIPDGYVHGRYTFNGRYDGKWK